MRLAHADNDEPGLPAHWREVAVVANEINLALWTLLALVGSTCGLGIGKYAQAWARAVFHPAALFGALLILVSTALA